MKDFHADFYGQGLSVVVLGYIRPELDYTSRGTTRGPQTAPLFDPSIPDSIDALIHDISFHCWYKGKKVPRRRDVQPSV